MKKLFTISIILLFMVSTAVDAQRWRTRRWEAYGGIGTANSYTDIGGAKIAAENFYGFKDFQIDFTRPSIVLGGKYKLNHRWYAKVNLAGAKIASSDLGTTLEIRPGTPESWGGGYEFSAYIFEPSVIAEFYILPESRSMVSGALFNRKGMINGFQQINLYVFAGIGSTISFPTLTEIRTGLPANTTNDEYMQSPEDTHKVALLVPAGIGARYELNSYWTINAEYGRRYPFTDVLDGYETKFSESNDVYDFLQVIVSYKIRTNMNGLPVLRNTGLRRRGLR